PALAATLARATVAGSGELLQRSPLDPATLRQNVTSPGGTTAAALDVLMGKDRPERLMTAAIAAPTKRSRDLAGGRFPRAAPHEFRGLGSDALDPRGSPGTSPIAGLHLIARGNSFRSSAMARKSARKSAARAASRSSKSERERIIDAFTALLAEKPIERIGFAEIAKAAKVSLADLRGAFASTLAILAAHMRETDRAVLAGGDADMAEEPPRERLFDVLMRRLELLAPHKAAV